LHPFYDFVVWSQTSWRWLELKLTQLGFLSNPAFHVTFVLDKTAMFTVRRKHKGKVRDHQVKALELIWAKCPQWHAGNTVHVDDLSRNFAMNPEEGIKCSAYMRKDIATGESVGTVVIYLFQLIAIVSLAACRACLAVGFRTTCSVYI
jgi:ubiquitin-like domain-containing CTD phosphatase 1